MARWGLGILWIAATCSRLALSSGIGLGDDLGDSQPTCVSNDNSPYENAYMRTVSRNGMVIFEQDQYIPGPFVFGVGPWGGAVAGDFKGFNWTTPPEKYYDTSPDWNIQTTLMNLDPNGKVMTLVDCAIGTDSIINNSPKNWVCADPVSKSHAASFSRPVFEKGGVAIIDFLLHARDPQQKKAEVCSAVLDTGRKESHFTCKNFTLPGEGGWTFSDYVLLKLDRNDGLLVMGGGQGTTTVGQFCKYDMTTGEKEPAMSCYTGAPDAYYISSMTRTYLTTPNRGAYGTDQAKGRAIAYRAYEDRLPTPPPSVAPYDPPPGAATDYLNNVDQVEELKVSNFGPGAQPGSPGFDPYPTFVVAVVYLDQGESPLIIHTPDVVPSHYVMGSVLITEDASYVVFVTYPVLGKGDGSVYICGTDLGLARNNTSEGTKCVLLPHKKNSQGAVVPSLYLVPQRKVMVRYYAAETWAINLVGAADGTPKVEKTWTTRANHCSPGELAINEQEGSWAAQCDYSISDPSFICSAKF